MPIFKKWKTGRFRQRLRQIWKTGLEVTGYGDRWEDLKEIWKPKE
jgi:hypothetical protein